MYHVLVVDDHDLVADVLDQALTRFGYRVTIASRGHEGLRLYDQGAFDLVITDMILPDMDGGIVARHVRNSSRPRTPVIGISGTAWLLARGRFDAVLAKPFSLKNLLQVVHRLVPGRPVTCQKPSCTSTLNA